MRFMAFILVFLITAPTMAQGVDWDKIGRPLGEDTVDVYDRYVYFDETKTTNPNVPLSSPLLSREAMASWMADTLSQVMTLSSLGYRQELSEYKPYFTDKGLKAFIGFLEEQAVLTTLENNQAQLGTVVEFTPDIIADDVFEGVYRWNANIPLILSFRNSNAPQQSVTVNVDVVRVPFGKNADGFAFDHWQTREKKNDAVAPEGEEENRLDQNEEDAYQ